MPVTSIDGRQREAAYVQNLTNFCIQQGTIGPMTYVLVQENKFEYKLKLNRSMHQW